MRDGCCVQPCLMACVSWCVCCVCVCSGLAVSVRTRLWRSLVSAAADCGSASCPCSCCVAKRCKSGLCGALGLDLAHHPPSISMSGSRRALFVCSSVVLVGRCFGMPGGCD
ncbi:hypothetical protein COO60DRAFT_1568439 [Scenedesmus sp. NREL 46B-D3]|nr:hypothetical protein COO60DRAFT_1568439 [Scenedesmus sp. NREL 46B-D3]